MRIITVLFLLFIHQTSFADTSTLKNNTRESKCDECSESNSTSKYANSWHLITLDSSGGYLSHIIDEKTYDVITYDFSSVGDNEIPQDLLPNFIRSTPIEIINVANQLKTEFTEIEKILKKEVIPEKTLKSAWHLMNCGFCKGDIENYIKQKSSIKNSLLHIEKAINGNNITTALLSKEYTMNIETGGNVKFQLYTINFTDISIKYLSANDENGNEIPKHDTSLIGKEIKIGNNISAEFINSIINQFNLFYEPKNEFSGIIKDKS